MNNKESFRYKHFLRTMTKVYNSNLLPLFTFEEYNGRTKPYNFKCKQCNFEFLGTFNNNKISKCPKCNPNRLTKNYGHPKILDIYCKNCNNIFTIKWEYRNRKFCSINCKIEFDKIEHREHTICPTCKNSFQRYKNKNNQRIYCSDICSNTSLDKKNKLKKWIKSNNPMNNQLSIDKIKKTKCQKYGAATYNNMLKYEQTMMIKYGVPYAVYLPSCKSNGKRISKFQIKVYKSILGQYPDAKLEEYLSDVKKFVDIYIPSIKKVIECHGDYWHCNPILFNSSYYNKTMNLTANEIWEKDNKKKEILESNGYKVDIIWENSGKKFKHNINTINN